MKLSFTRFAAFLIYASSTMAQDYPAKPIRFIIPLAPGGGGDILARSIAQSSMKNGDSR